MRQSYLRVPAHVPQRAAFPVIDAHNHLWGSWGRIRGTIRAMDACGVALYADLTSNLTLRWSGGGYTLRPGRFEDFLAATAREPRRWMRRISWRGPWRCCAIMPAWARAG